MLQHLMKKVLSLGLLRAGLCFPTGPEAEPQVRDAAPTVNLDYASYTGYYDATFGLNYFKGIRYADAPTGAYRWAKPRPPPQASPGSAPIVLNTNWPPACPQTPSAPGGGFALGTEDCLYLSVIAPPDAQGLPVLVYIHGGGYGGGAGNYDFTEMVINNNRGFIFVGIQYRLGAFGFLSSAEMSQFGTPNAGLWDQEFALQWVQDYISSFGGDPTRVTVSGESAGGGSVMTLAMAHGGANGTSLFQNAIAASPYLPQQWDFDGEAPTTGYNALASEVGCLTAGTANPNDGSVLECLRAVNSATLQQANYDVTVAGTPYLWTFMPVTDGVYLMDRPSVQLLNGQVNGARIMSTYNADDGASFVPTNIATDTDFVNYLLSIFTKMSDQDILNVAQTYAIAPVIPGTPNFATQGDQGPTAMNQSSFGTGQQQRAFNLYAETTFMCPSYWLAEAYARQTGDAWQYQFSVPGAQHGMDLDAYVSDNYINPGSGTMSPAFRVGVQTMWGRFVMYNDPTLPDDVVAALTTDAGGNPTGDVLDGAKSSSWARWDKSGYSMLNLNMTGPAEQAAYSVVNGYTWEGGRGGRCDAWAAAGSLVPE